MADDVLWTHSRLSSTGNVQSSFGTSPVPKRPASWDLLDRYRPRMWNPSRADEKLREEYHSVR
jgi:hypothetical protein